MRAGDEDPGVEFMLSELSNLRAFLQEDTNVDERRLDVLLLLISSIGAGVGLMAQAGIPRTTLLSIILFASATVPMLSIPIFTNTIARDISAVDYIRAVNDIRQYFMERSAAVNATHMERAIERHLLMPGRAAYPAYGGLSSNRSILAVITSGCFALLLLVLCLLLYNQANPDPATILGMSVVFLATFALHWNHWHRKYRLATEDAEVYGSTALAKSRRANEPRARLSNHAPWRRKVTPPTATGADDAPSVT